MNCENVISQMGFSCRDLGGETLRVWSPFTYCGDGERVGFYVEKINSGYRITDACEAMMNAAALGAQITDSRMDAVRRAVGCETSLSDDGEISAFVTAENVGSGMAAVLNAALAVSHLKSEWKPRLQAETFLQNVEQTLKKSFEQRLLRKVTITGASGHQLELPLGVQNGDAVTYVQPIAATEENTVDWKRVYEAWGKMSDIKNSHNEHAQRLIVLEDSANDPEMKNAMSILLDSASVVRYSALSRWFPERRAA